MVYDAARGVTMVVGNSGCNDTQIWNGIDWSSAGPAPHSSRWVGGMVYDSGRQVVVAVLGNQSTGVHTYEWAGTSWILRDSGGVTPARGNFTVVYDEARGVTLLFGGNSGNDPTFADLWAWDGSAWTLIYIGGPTPRRNAQMVYDSVRQTVVLFGGWGFTPGNQPRRLGDTWEWNGSYWFQHFGIPGPDPRRSAGFVFDTARGKAVLIGGSADQGAAQDVWEWDGTVWQQHPTPMPASSLYETAAYDPVRGVITALANAETATIEYVPLATTPATASPYGAGCAGPAGTPTLAGAAGSLPTLGAAFSMQLTSLPASPFNVPIGFLGFDNQLWGGMAIPVSLSGFGMPGCDAWLAPVGSEVLVNNLGSATWSFDVPVNAFALGVHVYFQGAVSVPGWNAAGFVFSNGIDATIGI